MAGKAHAHDVRLRPHFKTHQSLEIGRWFKSYGVDSITVSSVDMAQYFSEEWNDITIAFPLNILELDEINLLAKKVRLQVLIESEEAMNELLVHANTEIGFFIKIDTGANRTGIKPEKNIELINRITSLSDKSHLLTFKGFLTHAGHTYSCRTKNEICEVHDASISIMNDLKKKFLQKYPDLEISVGDTPGCSVSDNFYGVDEIRPGNFIFYDLMQAQIGSCHIDEIGVAVACPVVAIHQDRAEMNIYGGAIHFSKEQLILSDDSVVYGQAIHIDSSGFGQPIDNMYLTRLSQEHGVVKDPADLLSTIAIGDIIYVLPVHSCLTAHLTQNDIKIILQDPTISA